MAALTKTVLSVVALACLWVSVAAEGGWAVPAIPAGRRAQFYLQKADGGYHYGYDTGEGSDAEARADARNEVAGRYAFVGTDGRRVALAYTAGVDGFVPQLDASGAGNSAWQGGSSSTSSSSSSSSSSNLAGARGNSAGYQSIVVNAAPSTSSAGASAAPFNDPDYDENADASYSFGFDTASYQRQEAADPRGNVRGSYAYSSPEGGRHSVSYIAGENTGFVVTGGSSNEGKAAGPAPVLPPPQLYSAPGPIPVPSPALTPSVYSGSSSNAPGASGSDGSYSFSFNTGEQSRQESADASNNVRGSFSFKAADDGQTRKVDYVAGSGTGFLAKGDHLPVAPPAASGPALASAYSKPSKSIGAPYSGPASNAQVSSDPDGSYSFSFTTGEQSRQETADAQNNVRGSYSFKSAGDGQTRRIDYQAGAATGFVASGDLTPSLISPVAPAVYSAPVGPIATIGPVVPLAPVVPVASLASSNPYLPPARISQGPPTADGSYSFSYTTGAQSRQEAADAQNNVVGSYSFTAADDGQTRRVDYQAGASTGFVARGDHLPVAPAGSAAGLPGASYAGASPTSRVSAYSGPSSSSQAASNADGAYSFSYNTGEQSRQESADANNNVRGSYSFKAPDDGQTRRVDYVAGSATGFVASGEHLPKPQSAPVAGSSAYAAPKATVSRVATTHASSAANSGTSGGSYSFSYDAGDHARQEASDGSGNVRGSFTFVAKDDKQSRRVDYSAGAGTGFLASGAHIPAAPAATAGYASGVYAPGAGAYSSGAGAYSSGSSISGSGSADDAASGDASYSYSYRTDSSSKTETSDAQGNVRGEFTYLGADGVTRKLSYTSVGDTGFVASGDVHPVVASNAVGTNSAAQTSRAGLYGGSQGSSYSSSRRHSYAGSRTGAAFRDGGAVVNQYLPPQSAQKYGYIYDTKA